MFVWLVFVQVVFLYSFFWEGVFRFIPRGDEGSESSSVEGRSLEADFGDHATEKEGSKECVSSLSITESKFIKAMVEEEKSKKKQLKLKKKKKKGEEEGEDCH